MSRLDSYVVIIPARDEAEYIRRTLDCLESQTMQPSECIVVDDGSTDATPQIVEAFGKRLPWLRLVKRTDRGVRQRGAGVVQAFYDGLGQARCTDWGVVVKLDADISFAPFYFEELLQHFSENPRLGIVCGALYIFRSGRWVLDKAPLDRTWGPTKVYRRECFEAIGGIVPHIGWDAVDDFKAQLLGWKTRTFEDLVVLHYRPVGKRSGRFNSGVEHGRGNYYLGTHPLFMLVRVAYRMLTDRPIILAGLGMLYGYLSSWAHHGDQINDPSLVRFVRSSQLARLDPFARIDRLTSRWSPGRQTS